MTHKKPAPVEIPVPARGRPAGTRYPFASMQVGEHQFVEDGGALHRYRKAAARYCAAHGGKFTFRVFEPHVGGFKFWRVA